MAAKSRILARLVACVAVVGAIVATSASTASGFAGGTGTSGDPYQIASCADLMTIDDSVANLSKSYVLNNNIDCTGVTVTPMQYSTTYFSGVLDGNNKSISNVSITCPANYCGLFTRSTSGTFRYLTLDSFSLTGAYNLVGALVGYAGGTTTVTGVTVTGVNISAANTAGGLLGQCLECIMNTVSVSGTVTTSGNMAGGLVGDFGGNTANASRINNATSSASVSGVSYVGGIVGYGYRSAYSALYGIFSSTFSGTVVGSGVNAVAAGGIIGNATNLLIDGSSSSGSVTGVDWVGGIGGAVRTNASISKSWTTGTIVSTTTSCSAGAGGIGGMVEFGSITESYSVAAVSGVCRSGGIVANGNGPVSNSFFRGSLTRTSGTDASFGGISGRGPVNITNSYASTTNSYSYGEGIAGDIQFIGVCTASYWNTTTSGRATTRCGAGGVGKTTAQLTTQSTFSAWDFTNVWNIDPSTNDGYPYLRAVPTPGADITPPTAAWTAPSSPSSSRTMSYTLTFSEAVSGIASGDFSFGGTATGCTATPAASTASNSVTVSVVCGSDGTVIARLGANSVLDAASNTGPPTLTSAGSVTINTAVATTTTAAPASTTTVAVTTTVPSTTTTTVAGATTTTVPSTTTTVVAAAAGTTTVPVSAPSSGATSTTVAQSSSAPTTSVAASAGQGGQVAGSVTTTVPPTTTTVAPAPTSTLPEIDVPRTQVGGASALIGGVEVSAKVTREDNELVVDVGPISARIWATARSGGKVPLDAQGRLRLQVGDSVTVDIEGFDAATPVEVRLYSDPVLLGRSQVGASGTLAAAYEIPAGVEQGDHTVVLAGTGKGDSVTLALSVAIGDESAGINPWVIIVPIGLAVLGALLLPVALRRKRRATEA